MKNHVTPSAALNVKKDFKEKTTALIPCAGNEMQAKMVRKTNWANATGRRSARAFFKIYGTSLFLLLMKYPDAAKNTKFS